MVEHAVGRFRGAGGTELFRQRWRPTDVPPRSALINLHGLGDHSGLYPTVVEYFGGRGHAVHAFDLRGNGRSPGQRGYVGRWREYREDLAAFVQLVTQEEPQTPIFLLGNSLGGLIALDYALYHPDTLAGVAAAAPPLGSVGVPPLLLALGRMVSGICPRFSLETKMDLGGLAHDPAVVEAVLSDPLFHRRGTARLSTEVTATIQSVQQRAPSLAVPLLIVHGSADRMVSPDGSRAFVARVSGADAELREYPDAYHGLFVDIHRDQVLADVAAWIDRHLDYRG